jgi:hypothetical protein
MIYRGTVEHGVIELEGGVTLPDGTRVKVEPLTTQQDSPTQPSETMGWPAGYFEQTFGSITDDTFDRPVQGDLPKAVDLE